MLAAKQLARLSDFEDIAKVPSSETHHALAVKGTEGIAITYSKCCRPIPGDHITGYIEPGHGLIIHTEQCPMLDNYRHIPDKLIPLRWEDKTHADFQSIYVVIS